MKDSDYFWKSLLAGGLSGSIAKTVTAPLDRVKILFQAQNPHYQQYARARFGPFKAVAEIYREFGVRGLYQGHTATLFRIAPSAAIRFMSYEQMRMWLIPSPEYESSWRHFVAGSVAGNTAVMATYPLEVVRSRLAYQVRTAGDHYSMASTIRTIYREAGPLGFFKGFGPTMLGIIPYAGTAFSSFQYMKIKCLQYPQLTKNGQKDLIVPVHLMIGGLSGMLGQTIAYPLDTIRHRMQLYGVNPGVKGRSTYPFYKHTWHAVRTILSSEGGRSFFYGLSINWYKTMPANAIAFVSYDYLKKALLV